VTNPRSRPTRRDPDEEEPEPEGEPEPEEESEFEKGSEPGGQPEFESQRERGKKEEKSPWSRERRACRTTVKLEIERRRHGALYFCRGAQGEKGWKRMGPKTIYGCKSHTLSNETVLIRAGQNGPSEPDPQRPPTVDTHCDPGRAHGR
jgi:hypothetical protein